METGKNFLIFYDEEKYLLETVGPSFRDSGKLTAEDFLTILSWKAGRAITHHLKRLRGVSGSFEAAVKDISAAVAAASEPSNKLKILMSPPWCFYLATATAILTILYPEEFTVYDYRVVEQIGFGKELRNREFSGGLWDSYQEFKRLVLAKPLPELGLKLRDCDRYLSGKSYREDITRLCREYSDPNGTLDQAVPS